MSLPPPVIRDQLNIPCCVSIAVVTAMEILDSATAPPAIPLSPLFNYYRARRSPGLLERIDLAAGVNAAMSAGVCPQDLHPVAMDVAGATSAPSGEATARAEAFRLVGYDPVTRQSHCHPLPDNSRSEEWRACLAAGAPVLFGLWVTSAYDAAAQAPDFRHGDPSGLPVRDGHALAVVGYDDGLRSFDVADCQGPGFGIGGRWWLPYEVAEMQPYVFESWVVRRITY